MADTAINGDRQVFNVVGTPNLPGRLSPALATGVAKFGVDFNLPDMLHAKFLRSPFAHSRVKKIDPTKALAIPGVVDVVMWDDPEIKELHSFNGRMFLTNIPWMDDEGDMEGGEVGCIVVAETEDLCEEALDALEIEWDELGFVTDLLKGREKDAPVIRPDIYQPPHLGPPPKEPFLKIGNVYHEEMSAGDIEKGFAEADDIVEYRLYTPVFASHMPNPSGSVAWWADDFYEGAGKNLHIEGAVRGKDAIAQLYKMPPNKTIQESLFMGGKYCDWGLRKSQEVTPLLAKRYGRPVRCMNTREDTYDFLMNARWLYLKVGYTKEGLITAFEDHSVADYGIRGSAVFGNAGDIPQGPYNTIRCPNIHQYMEIVESNRGKMYVSGQHCPYNWDTVTTAIHMIAEKLGKDPIEIARLNVHGPTGKDDPNPVRSFEMCIEAGKKLMDWDWKPAKSRQLPDGRWFGTSFRYQMSPRHSVGEYRVKLEYRDGRVHLPTQGPLFGAYVVETNAIIVAEELGIHYEDVVVDYDSREPYEAYGGGADATSASGWCFKECADKLKRQLLQEAIDWANDPEPGFFSPGFTAPPLPKGPFQGLTVDDLDITDSRVVLKSDPTQGINFNEITHENLFATYKGRPPADVWVSGQMGLKLATMNTSYCEVAVDTETGEVEILRFGVAADVGKVIRPTSLESQIDQVMYFTQGCQLFEDLIYDPRTGVRLNNNMIEYKKPGILDVPHVDRVFPESRDGNAVYGASGISHSMANTHMVIIAIYNAIGVWVDPPATPDKILKALGKA
ncbi:MAG: molybdopterin-dependent oxidoreductase [Coriobacteriales bacterium]|jgi:xanthine dehydrogenase molybdenum-binding subunit|nr:molybdopterin-dependent oxidoreductase [Coriobacteriales bacterium]